MRQVICKVLIAQIYLQTTTKRRGEKKKTVKAEVSNKFAPLRTDKVSRKHPVSSKVRNRQIFAYFSNNSPFSKLQLRKYKFLKELVQIL